MLVKISIISYELIDCSDFRNEIMRCLKKVLNRKEYKKTIPSIQKDIISSKKLKEEFLRFYDNWFSFQFRCFCEDNTVDNRETVMLFGVYYKRGDFGHPSYLTDRMYSRNERLLELISLMEEEDRHYRMESRRLRDKYKHLPEAFLHQSVSLDLPIRT